MGSSGNRGPEEARATRTRESSLTLLSDVVVSPSPSPPSVAGVFRLDDFFSACAFLTERKRKTD